MLTVSLGQRDFEEVMAPSNLVFYTEFRREKAHCVQQCQKERFAREKLASLSAKPVAYYLQIIVLLHEVVLVR